MIPKLTEYHLQLFLFQKHRKFYVISLMTQWLT